MFDLSQSQRSTQMIFMLKSQRRINFSQFDFDFDNFSVSGFQATKTLFKPQPKKCDVCG